MVIDGLHLTSPAQALDYYKLTMLNAFHTQVPGLEVEYKSTIRSKGVDTAQLVPVVQAAVRSLAELKFQPEDMSLLRKVPYLNSGFCTFIEDYRFHPEQHCTISAVDGNCTTHIVAPIDYGTLYETIVMQFLSEARTDSILKPGTEERYRAEAAGIEELRANISLIKSFVSKWGDRKPYRLIEGGTRRRFSYQYHRKCLEILKTEIPDQLFGTSNVWFAHEFNLRPVGTQAHEFNMVFQQCGPRVKDFVKAALQAWVDQYRGNLGYALPDVLTTEAFLNSFDLYFAKLYDGMRHDSGCPHKWTKMVTDHYRKLGINPASKYAVYSNGLTIRESLELCERYEGEPWPTSYLIGGGITNNIPGFPGLSQVIKMTKCNHEPVAKISDEPGKAVCESPEFLAYLKQTFRIS